MRSPWLGKAIATCFAREGGKLVIAARSLTEIEQTTKEIIDTGGQAISVQTDVGGVLDMWIDS